MEARTTRLPPLPADCSDRTWNFHLSHPSSLIPSPRPLFSSLILGATSHPPFRVPHGTCREREMRDGALASHAPDGGCIAAANQPNDNHADPDLSPFAVGSRTTSTPNAHIDAWR